MNEFLLFALRLFQSLRNRYERFNRTSPLDGRYASKCDALRPFLL